MLDDSTKGQLAAYFERITQPIELIASLDDSQGAADIRELITEIAAVAPAKISTRFDGQFERRPSFQITRVGQDMGVHFAALPMGHEFTSLLLALLWAGGHPPKQEPEVMEQIKALEGDFSFTTWMSLTCHNCPDVVQALNLMAVLNPRVRHVAIDGGLFQEEVERRQIMAVPKTELNGADFASGRIELGEILAKIDTGAARREAAKLNEKAPFDVLIIGGGPAGAAAAVYAARKGIRTGIVAERFGGQTMDTLGHRELHLRTGNRRPEIRRRAGSPCAPLRRGRDDAAARGVPHPAGAARRAGHRQARQRRRAEEPHRDPGHRRTLAQHERARRAGVQDQGRGLLPALRRPAVQGQGRGGDRRRQLRRGSRHRPGRRGPQRHGAGVHGPAQGRRRCWWTNSRACPTSPSTSAPRPPRWSATARR
jgi:hypothetical protein